MFGHLISIYSLLQKQLTPIEKYALHYLEYLNISDEEAALKVNLVYPHACTVFTELTEAAKCLMVLSVFLFPC